LAAKMSCVQTGFFMSSYKLAPGAYFAKVGLSQISFQAISYRYLQAYQVYSRWPMVVFK
jgi:hypothetical protein